MSVTVLVGNPRSGSRTRAAAEHTALRLANAVGADGEIETIELADLGPALLEPGPPPAVVRALERTRSAGILVVASPTYKATYTGLLKAYLDLVPGDGLVGVRVIPLLVMASPAHTLAVDMHLRPLLLELGADVPVSGLALIQDDIPSHEDAGPPTALDEVLGTWVERVAPALRASYGSHAQAAGPARARGAR